VLVTGSLGKRTDAVLVTGSIGKPAEGITAVRTQNEK
jgi:hypothetical protein